MIIAEAFENWSRSTSLAQSTVKQYRFVPAKLERHQLVSLEQIDRKSLCRYQDARRGEGRKPKTVNNDVYALLTVLQWLERRGDFPGERLAALGRLKLRVPRAGPPTYYTRAEYPELARVAWEIAPWFGLAFEVATLTGARRGELRRMDAADFNTLSQVVRIERKTVQWGEAGETKSRAERTVPLCADMIQILHTHAPAGGPMFASTSKRAKTPYISQDSMTWAMRELAIRTGKKTTWHRCRRTFTTWALQAKVQPTDVARWLGHTTLDILYRSYAGWIHGYDPEIERLTRPRSA